MKIHNSNLTRKKRSFFGHASSQVWASREITVYLEGAFSLCCPQVAQLDDNDKDPTSPGNVQLPGILSLLQLKHQRSCKLFLCSLHT